MDKSVEEVPHRHPHAEEHNAEGSNTAKGGDQALQPQSLDQNPDDTDNELPCMTPTTTSSEDADKSSDDAGAATNLRVDDEKSADAVSGLDDQTLSKPNEEAASSDQNGRGPDGAAQTEPDPQLISKLNGVENEAKDDDSEGSKTEDVKNEGQVGADTKDHDDSAPHKEPESTSQEEGENEDKEGNKKEDKDEKGDAKDDKDRIEDKQEDKEEDKDESKVKEETASSPPKEPEVDPAQIELPKSPYFNPFDAPAADKDTSSRRGSIDGIPSLDDTPEYVEPVVESLAKREWARRKEQLGEKSEPLDKVMEMVGLEAAKSLFLEVKDMIEASRSRQGHLQRRAFNVVMMGNPGTGKRTLAKLYKELLEECGVWGKKQPTYACFEEQSGHMLKERLDIYNLRDLASKGVIYISEADFVKADKGAYFMETLKLLSDDVVFVLSGSFEQMPELLGSSPVARWLFPRLIHIEDYNDDELRRLFVQMVKRDSFKMEQGPQGPFTRIVAQRAGRGRDEAAFGNVRELQLSYGKILERHSIRIRQRLLEIEDSWTEPLPDENFLSGQDLIGPEPEDVRTKSKAWKELQKMAGLEEVKAAVEQLLNRAKANYHREIAGMKLLKTSLNRVFIGPPGTGKTTVAKLYGQILADIGLVSSRNVIYKTPSDFIGEFIGESERKTSAIIDSAKGKTLIIDDAHMFYHGQGLSENQTDEFRLACIDVIVSKIHNRPGDDRCVILVGYPDRMEEMFQKCNPGLRRRFPLEEAFRFYDYDDERLKEIFDLKMEEEGIKATPAAMEVAAEVLQRARDRPNFGNGGDVVNFVNQAKARYRVRVSKTADADAMETVLEPEDFDPHYNRGATAAERCRAHFDGLIGFEDTIKRFESYQRIAANLRLNNKDPRGIIPFNYVFKGPPGTGKTHTARIIGRIFYDMGFLSTSEVIECSATHLIGKYVGHTGPKVVELFERSLGKVLFIDEAYRLRNTGKNSFANEAIGEIVDCMTKPRYYRKIVIVLAGYTHDMDLLLKANAGLRGRFATEIHFSPMSPESALRHLCELLAKQDIEILRDEDGLDVGGRGVMMGLLVKLAKTKGWSNGRDMQTLAGVVTEYVYGNMDGRGLVITIKELVRLMGDMLQQRKRGELE